jgi:hypothetical protein
MPEANGPKKNNGPKEGSSGQGSSNGGPGATPASASSPPSKPAWWRRPLGTIAHVTAAPFKAAEGVVAAAGVKASAAGRAVAGAAGTVFQREALTAAAAIVAAVAAVLAWRGTVDSETRQVSSELLDQFNSDEMWKAHLTLERYYYVLSGDKTAPADLARQTEDYFKTFVYQKAALPSGRGGNKFGSDRDRQEDFLRQVDQSRQKIKNFYEDVIIFSENRLLTNAFREKVLKTRFRRNAGDFLECFWLPVELGQSAALYQGRKADNEKRACQVVDWYREKYPVVGRPASLCVPYAPRQPDFCVDPKAEMVEAQ